jgi:hypothetical protein
LKALARRPFSEEESMSSTSTGSYLAVAGPIDTTTDTTVLPLPSLLRSGMIQAASEVTVALVNPTGSSQNVVHTTLFFWEKVQATQVSTGYDSPAVVASGFWSVVNFVLDKGYLANWQLQVRFAAIPAAGTLAAQVVLR